MIVGRLLLLLLPLLPSPVLHHHHCKCKCVTTTMSGGGCALHGGCPTDYISISVSVISLFLLVLRAAFPFLVHKGHTMRSSGFWLVIIQIIGSFNLILSLVMSINYVKSNRRHRWQSCYTWAVWFEGPLGFGLLMTCRIIQAFQLYFLFVKRQLPPVTSRVLFPLILFPWIAGAAFIHSKRPLNRRCHMRNQWIIPVVCIHVLYVAALIVLTLTIRQINFRFHELKELVRGIIGLTFIVGMWIIAYVLNEIHEDIPWIQVASRFFLLVMASILLLAIFSVSVSQPLLSQLSLRKRSSDFPTMSVALGIEDSGLIKTTVVKPMDVNKPLDKLLQNTKFLQSFMAFADSCLAGESVHFYDEVTELSKIPANDSVRRIYMAMHIIEKYIITGAEMEVNISHRCRQEILSTLDLTLPNLFDEAVIELIHLMKSNLLKDYWSSMFYVKLCEEHQKQSEGHDEALWNVPSRLSFVFDADDPFNQQDHKTRKNSGTE